MATLNKPPAPLSPGGSAANMAGSLGSAMHSGSFTGPGGAASPGPSGKGAKANEHVKIPADLMKGCEMLFVASAGDIDVLDAMYAEDKNIIHFKDYDARSAIHLAASEGHIETVAWLIQRGADVNVTDRWNNTPLQDAMRGKFLEVKELLLANGATLPAATATKVQIIGEVLQMAGDGDLEGLRGKFLDDPTCVNFHDYDNRYALHLAASEGHLEVVTWLLDNGAEVNVKDRWSGTPLEDAIRTSRAAIVDLLNQRGGRLIEDGQLVRMHTLPSVTCVACQEERANFIPKKNRGGGQKR